MANTKSDRRFKYTEMILKNSLIDMLKSGPIEKITVSELCKNADINRATFYMHYDRVDNLLFDIQDDLYKKIQLEVKKVIRNNIHQSSVLTIFQVIQENKDLCKVLLSQYGDKIFLKKIITIAKNEILSEWKNRFNLTNKRKQILIYEYIINGCIGLIQEWLNNDTKESPEEIADIIMQTSNYGLKGIKKQS